MSEASGGEKATAIRGEGGLTVGFSRGHGVHDDLWQRVDHGAVDDAGCSQHLCVSWLRDCVSGRSDRQLTTGSNAAKSKIVPLALLHASAGA